MSSSVLVLFRGLPGVGKSTLAAAVARELDGAPLVDKDDHRDALAEVFDGEDEQIDDDERRRRRELFNEAAYSAAFNAARTLFLRSRSPCVLLDSPLSRASTAERALALAEAFEVEGGVEGYERTRLRFVVVAVGTSDERLWRARLEARAKELEEIGSHSAKHKPRDWETVAALRERGRREGARTEREGEGARIKGEGEGGEATTFRDRMLRDLGVDGDQEPFARLWRGAAARFVVDTSRGEEGKVEASEAIAKAVRAALSDQSPSTSSDVIFID